MTEEQAWRRARALRSSSEATTVQSEREMVPMHVLLGVVYAAVVNPHCFCNGPKGHAGWLRCAEEEARRHA